MTAIIVRPTFTKDLDGLRRSARKVYQRVTEILVEIQQDIRPSAPQRSETRIPKCHKFELPDGYRLVLQETDAGGALVAITVGTHDQVDSFLVWWFRSPHHCCRELVMRNSEPKPH